VKEKKATRVNIATSLTMYQAYIFKQTKIKYTLNHWYNSSARNVGTRRTIGNEIKLKVEHVTRQISPLQLIFTIKKEITKACLEYLFLYLQMHLQEKVT